jgi:hypothetical protein
MRHKYMELALLVMDLTTDGTPQGSRPYLSADEAIWVSVLGFESGENQLEYDVLVIAIAPFM